MELLRKSWLGPVYDTARTGIFPAILGGSNLSPHLRAGTIGIAHGFLAAFEKKRVSKPSLHQLPAAMFS